METNIYTCHESSTIKDVLRILVEKEVSGIPVINDLRHVVGFISDGDIMNYIGKQNPKYIDLTSYVTVLYDDQSLDQKIEDLIKLNVLRLATKKVVSVNTDFCIDKVASVLGKKKIKKAPVLEDGKIVGIITRSAIIRYIAQIYLRKVQK